MTVHAAKTQTQPAGRDDYEHLKTVIEQAWSAHAGLYDQMWGQWNSTGASRRSLANSPYALVFVVGTLSPFAPGIYRRTTLVTASAATGAVLFVLTAALAAAHAGDVYIYVYAGWYAVLGVGDSAGVSGGFWQTLLILVGLAIAGRRLRLVGTGHPPPLDDSRNRLIQPDPRLLADIALSSGRDVGTELACQSCGGGSP